MPKRIIPIYTTKGDVDAYLVYPWIYNGVGDWIGAVSPDQEVYSVYGEYIGWMSRDPRILRKRAYSYDKPKRPLKQPSRLKITFPATMPLAPMMAELDYSTIDVLLEAPELLPTIDAGEFRQDMD